ncbi:MAG TPA: class I SAM-dependent methyltransferase [Candidatus Saccharimonadales bacterium]|nr:class I SAM-dependent methyltransferase [Candidatus Saccharimonadales bacterium]
MSIQFPGSKSEDNGIALLTDADKKIYSVGISTGGIAEIRMAQADPARHIIATTIDQEGLAFAQKYIHEKGLDAQIEAKLEDVAQPLPYQDDYFDFVYARLVLHYVPKAALDKALAELHRVLKPAGRLFVVVRSVECPDVKDPSATYDPETGLTTRVMTNEETGRQKATVRYFHTEQSITDHMAKAGFTIQHITSYDERLYSDFMRTKQSPHDDNVIEVVATK